MHPGKSSLLPAKLGAAAEADAVRPFRIKVPEAARVDLRRRVVATRWPDRETLTDPTAYGGRAEDAFDLVLPSMPGYGFSGKPHGTGWGPDRIARAWAVLMERLGYKGYGSQGGDWGAVVADVMARHAPAGLLGIHVNMPATVPADVAKALNHGDPAPSGLSDTEKAAFESLETFYKKNTGYSAMMGVG